jgi:CheY-like chemotaxis protein
LPTNIEIRQNIEKDVGHILADPTRVHQVLMNLCTNAAHAMGDEGGIMEVNLAEVDSSPDLQLKANIGPGKYLKLTVSDTGHGIDPKVIHSIFDPYFTTKKKGEGTGMGLSIVHGIVKSLRGEIMVQSDPGTGSTFDVYFPKIKKENLRVLDVDEMLPKGNERILFLDDEPELAALGEQMLDELGYKVDTRTSSAEALELFRMKSHQFDLVITDMNMPHMTGDKLAREIINIRPDIPIILCTGYSDRISDEAAKKIGIRQFVMKPIEMRKLANIVRRALDLN